MSIVREKELKGLDFISKGAPKEVVKKWVSNEDDVFFTAGPDLLLLDESQTEWVALDDYMSIKNTDDELDLISIGDRSGKQEKWLIADGYFIKKSEFSDLQNDLSSKNLRKYHSLKVQETSINYLTVNMAGHRGIRGL